MPKWKGAIRNARSPVSPRTARARLSCARAQLVVLQVARHALECIELGADIRCGRAFSIGAGTRARAGITGVALVSLIAGWLIWVTGFVGATAIGRLRNVSVGITGGTGLWAAAILAAIRAITGSTLFLRLSASIAGVGTIGPT